MKTIRPLAEIPLGHRAYHWASSEAGWMIASTQDGKASIIEPSLRLEKQVQIPGPVKGLSLSPTGELLAVVGAEGIVVLRRADFRGVLTLEGPYLGACFSLDSRLLWTACPEDEQTIAIETRGTDDWEVSNSATLDDPFSESSFMLNAIPSRQDVAIWAAAGQDGQAIFWGQPSDKGLRVERFGDLDQTLPPSFNPTGDEFMLARGSDELWHCTYPAGQVLSRRQIELEQFDLAEEPSCDGVNLLDHHRALVQAAEGRLFLLDVTTMRVIDEVALVGHEPRPAREVWPTLGNLEGSCSDVCDVEALDSSRMVSVHHELPMRHPDDWKDHILVWDRGVLEE